MTEVKETFQEALTPSGIEIRYEWEPKRVYRLRLHPEQKGNDFLPSDWAEVVSVTTALDVLDKPGLPWWGMETGVTGLMSLLKSATLGVLNGHVVDPGAWQPTAPLTVEAVIEKLKQFKLTVNQVKRKAGDRGQAVHDALEAWADGRPIDPTIFPPEAQGYVLGLLAFLKDVPSAEPVASEVMVGSLEYGFAGRYDIRFRTTSEHAVVVHRTPVRGPQWAKLPPGLYLGDLKTSKGVYQDKHGRQLEGYEGASIECGYEPTDGRGIIHVGPDGTYEFVRSAAKYEHFLNVLQVWKDDQEIKERSKR